jgi:hypothetical protein
VIVSLLGQQQQQQQQQQRPLLQVRFQYYPAPGLVGARCGGEGRLAASDEDEAVLGALFPGDTGNGEVRRGRGWGGRMGRRELCKASGPGWAATGARELQLK